MIFKYLFLGLLTIIVYFQIPYSPVKSKYFKTINKFRREYESPKSIISKEDLEVLPGPLKKYFMKNGYVGIKNVNSIFIDFKNVDFSMGVNKMSLKINYSVYCSATEPIRAALIDSKLYTIPFQGMDLCKDAKSSMEGILGKHIRLFNTSFDMIDSSYLSECLLHPSLALQKNIAYKEIDDYTVEATLRKNHIETTGTFYFNEEYEMIKFVDNNRFSEGTKTYEKWSAVPSEYKIIDGVNRPTRFKAIWNYKEGDLLYFDGKDMKLEF